jgi:hypothetical protein
VTIFKSAGKETVAGEYSSKEHRNLFIAALLEVRL